MATERREMITEIEEREKVRRDELPKLAGSLDAIKGLIEIDRKVYAEESYNRISRNTEKVIQNCSDIADRLLFAGLEGGDDNRQ